MGDELDSRTDIYSLGCVMYEAVVGRPPFMAPNAVKTIFKHVNVKPDPLAVANPNINAPAELERLLFKTLEKKPEERYRSMEELRNDLNTLKSMMRV